VSGEKSVKGFGGKTPMDRDHVEATGVNGKRGLDWLLGNFVGGGVEWIRLAQDRDR
jgi:hypothetical protein